MRKRAIGSSYLLKQEPGCLSRVGGLRVTLSKSSANREIFTVKPTSYFADESLGANTVDTFSESAIDGIKQFAAHEQIDLAQFDVDLDQFLIHDVDSVPMVFFHAAQFAFRSAYEMYIMRF